MKLIRWVVSCCAFDVTRIESYPRGTIVNRTCGAHKTYQVYIYLFLQKIVGPTRYLLYSPVIADASCTWASEFTGNPLPNLPAVTAAPPIRDYYRSTIQAVCLLPSRRRPPSSTAPEGDPCPPLGHPSPVDHSEQLARILRRPFLSRHPTLPALFRLPRCYQHAPSPFTWSPFDLQNLTISKPTYSAFRPFYKLLFLPEERECRSTRPSPTI